MTDHPTTPVDLRADGVLWLINQAVFHPRGYALAINPATNEFSLIGDGTERWHFDEEAADVHFQHVEALLERARPGR